MSVKKALKFFIIVHKQLEIIIMLLMMKFFLGTDTNNSKVCGQARDKFHLAARRKKELKKN